MKTVTVQLPDSLHDVLVENYDGDINAGILSLMRHYGFYIPEASEEQPYPFTTKPSETCAAWLLMARHPELRSSRFPNGQSVGDAITWATFNKSIRDKLVKLGIKVSSTKVTFTAEDPFIRDIFEIHGFGKTWKHALLGFVGARRSSCGLGVVVPMDEIRSLVWKMQDAE